MTEVSHDTPDLAPNGDAIPACVAAAGAEAVAAWQEFVAGVPANSRQVYSTAVGTFLRWLIAHGMPLAQATADVVADYLNRPDLRSSTRAVYRAALRRYFAPLVTRGVLPSNPVEAPQVRRAEKRRDGPLRLEELKGYVHELAIDPVEEGTEEFDASLVLLAGVHFGTKRIMPLSRFTGVRPRQVAIFAERLRASGVWTDDGITAGEWTHEEYGQLAFWMDVWVAEGLLEKRGGCRSDETVIAL